MKIWQITNMFKRISTRAQSFICWIFSLSSFSFCAAINSLSICWYFNLTHFPGLLNCKAVLKDSSKTSIIASWMICVCWSQSSSKLWKWEENQVTSNLKSSWVKFTSTKLTLAWSKAGIKGVLSWTLVSKRQVLEINSSTSSSSTS